MKKLKNPFTEEEIQKLKNDLQSLIDEHPILEEVKLPSPIITSDDPRFAEEVIKNIKKESEKKLNELFNEQRRKEQERHMQAINLKARINAFIKEYHQEPHLSDEEKKLLDEFPH